MYKYAAYDLNISSEIELPGLLSGAAPCDVTVRFGKIPPLSVLKDNRTGADRVWGSALGRLRFLVEGGTSITVDVEHPLGEGVVRSVVQGVLIAALLRQRGLLAIHASGVVKNGQAIGFVGASGRGKSTLAELFCQHGYRTLGDDVMAIRVDGGHPVALPGPPLIQLRPEAGAWLRQDFKELSRVHAGSRKSIRPAMDVVCARPAPLAKLYVLDAFEEGESAVVPMAPGEALLALVQHTRAQNLLAAPVYTRANFRQCAEVIRHVPLSYLRRKRGFPALQDLLNTVERDVRTATVSSSTRASGETSSAQA